VDEEKKKMKEELTQILDFCTDEFFCGTGMGPMMSGSQLFGMMSLYGFIRVSRTDEHLEALDAIINCTNTLREELDPELLEKARQAIEKGIAALEKNGKLDSLTKLMEKYGGKDENLKEKLEKALIGAARICLISKREDELELVLKAQKPELRARMVDAVIEGICLAGDFYIWFSYSKRVPHAPSATVLSDIIRSNSYAKRIKETAGEVLKEYRNWFDRSGISENTESSHFAPTNDAHLHFLRWKENDGEIIDAPRFTKRPIMCQKQWVERIRYEIVPKKKG